MDGEREREKEYVLELTELRRAAKPNGTAKNVNERKKYAYFRLLCIPLAIIMYIVDVGCMKV